MDSGPRGGLSSALGRNDNDKGRSKRPGRNMLEHLAARVNGDPNLVRRGRSVSTTFLIAIDNTDHLVSVHDGKITGIRPGPFITPNYSFALRAPREAWEKLWSPTPIAGFTDIFALVKKKLLRIEGDLHPFMTHLLYFKGVLAAAHSADAAAGKA